jgi:hypothetical protein
LPPTVYVSPSQQTPLVRQINGHLRLTQGGNKLATGQSKQQSGREAFLAQRARLRQSLFATRTNDTASRFNRLDETQRKVIFMLANAAAKRFNGVAQLTRNQLPQSFEVFSSQEQRSLMLGIKRLAELAATMPWEFAEHAAPYSETQILRDMEATQPEPENSIN